MKHIAVLAGSIFSKPLLWAIAIVVIATAAFPDYSGATLQAHIQSSKAPVSSSGEAEKVTATIAVSGMTCGSCAAHIQGTLSKAPGVRSTEVSHEKGQVVVIFDPKLTSLEAIRGIIEAIGYQTDTPKASAEPPAVATTNALAEVSLSEVKEEFNRLRDKVRVLAILSPTCGQCQQGRGVISELFEKQDSEKLAGVIVWLPMKPKDSPQTAWLESEKVKDERIRVRGWDRQRQIGNLFAKPLILPSTAWDVYLVYAPGIQWDGKQPPKPSYWMHQLQGQSEKTMLCLNPAALSTQVQRFLDASK